MSLIGLIVTLVIVGFVLWLVNTYVPMDAKVRKILNVAVVVLILLWLLYSVLGLTHLGSVRID
jgi:hypothetical protein